MRPKKAVTKGAVVKTLNLQRDRIREKFKVKEIGLFGSFARGNPKKRSDIDILVEFEPDYETFDNYMELKFFLEEILKAKVDLVIKDAVRKELRERILSEAVYV